MSEGMSKDAKLFVAQVAKELVTKDADNTHSYFLMGRTLLDIDAFNKINSKGYDPVHGFTVVYGPFDSRKAVEEFVAEYPEDKWPGHNDWVMIKPGKPHILTHQDDPQAVDVVHNSTLEFQGQMMVNEMQRRAKEIQDVQDRMKEVEKEPEKLTKEQLETHCKMQEYRIDIIRKQLEGAEGHLHDMQALIDKEDDLPPSDTATE